MTVQRSIALVLTLLLAACGAVSLAPNAMPAAPGTASRNDARWIPRAGASYQIQYDGKLDLHVPAKIYDLDMFDTKASVVAQLHKLGRRVMCYISVGTWERWRRDAGKFPKSVLGNPDGHWKGER
ncbi:MAG: endo alpha-1,4 polygalactosaminidase [Candidatus Cybelea sp.]